MSERREYEMTEADLAELLEAMKPVPYMIIGGVLPSSVQKNANAAWARLGTKMGFKPMTVLPKREKGDRFFTAEPVEVSLDGYFPVGTRVIKPSGYPFSGEIRAVFVTRAGSVRYVVEATERNYAGMLHIFSPEQVEEAEV